MEQQMIDFGIPEIKVKLHNPKCIPERNGDWIDLRAAKDFEYKSGDFMMIPLGISMQLPKGYEGHLLPRSSTFKNFGVIMTNSLGK